MKPRAGNILLFFLAKIHQALDQWTAFLPDDVGLSISVNYVYGWIDCHDCFLFCPFRDPRKDTTLVWVAGTC